MASDERAGFRLERTEGRILELTCWGFWTLELARRYQRELSALMIEYEREGGDWFVCADITDYPVQRPEVAAVHGELMAESVRRGVRKAANVVSSAMTSMQIQRLSTESGLPRAGFHRTKAEARAWLLSPSVKP